MARTYKRDSNGRFAGGGGGGGGKKAASSRATNTARAKALQAKGTTAIGGRVKAKGFAGGKGAQERAGGLRSRQRPMLTGKGSGPRTSASTGTIGRSMRQMRQARKAARGAAMKQVNRARSMAGQAGKPPARTNKSPASAAKARYKELSSRARRSGAFRSPAENRSAAGARRSLNAMVAKRGRRR